MIIATVQVHSRCLTQINLLLQFRHCQLPILITTPAVQVFLHFAISQYNHWRHELATGVALTKVERVDDNLPLQFIRQRGLAVPVPSPTDQVVGRQHVFHLRVVEYSQQA